MPALLPADGVHDHPSSQPYHEFEEGGRLFYDLDRWFRKEVCTCTVDLSCEGLPHRQEDCYLRRQCALPVRYPQCLWSVEYVQWRSHCFDEKSIGSGANREGYANCLTVWPRSKEAWQRHLCCGRTGWQAPTRGRHRSAPSGTCCSRPRLSPAPRSCHTVLNGTACVCLAPREHPRAERALAGVTESDPSNTIRCAQFGGAVIKRS